MKARYPHEHDAVNAREYSGTRQLCSNCERPTGRCEEDSFPEGLCEQCFLDRACRWCGEISADLRRGWTGERYCSERCEREATVQLHSSMPGAGRCTFLPSNIEREIRARWSNDRRAEC